MEADIPVISIDDELEATPVRHGPAAQQERVLAQLDETEKRLFADYQRALQAAGWLRILEPARVAADVSGKEAQAIAARARKAQRQYAMNMEAFYASVPRRIKAGITDANRREALVEVAQHKAPRLRAQFLMLQDFELRAFDEIEAWVRWLNGARARWHVDAGEFVFHDEPDRATAAAHADAVDSLIQEQRRARTSVIGGAVYRAF